MMRSILPLLIFLVVHLSATAQPEHRFTPFVNIHSAFQFTTIRGIGSTSNISSITGSGPEIPVSPNYTTREENVLVFGFLVQGGTDVNVMELGDIQFGIRAGGGLGRQTGGSKAEGMDAFAKELFGYGYCRRTVGGSELAGFLGYKRYWGALPYHFIMLGAEWDFSENWGVMLSTSLNQYKYYRLFTNGYEEPALKVRELALTFVYRYQ